MIELIWDGKYKDRKKADPVRIQLPFQTVVTVNKYKLIIHSKSQMLC